ncbi:MAG TPA: hypothetical protein VG406_02915 [Isosphaeraceae bacterium]|nr:hypothetical protein [Isosphaeraceae bacterium]
MIDPVAAVEFLAGVSVGLPAGAILVAPQSRPWTLLRLRRRARRRVRLRREEVPWG